GLDWARFPERIVEAVIAGQTPIELDAQFPGWADLAIQLEDVDSQLQMEEGRHQGRGCLANADDRNLARFDERHLQTRQRTLDRQCGEIACGATAHDDNVANGEIAWWLR